MLNNEQRSNYWNYVTRNAKAVDDHEEIEKAKIEYVEMCMNYANAKYHGRFLPCFFHLVQTDNNWKVERSPIWEFFCGELIKSYHSLRLDSDLTYLASCAIMEQIRNIESEGYEYNDDDNTFLLELPIQYILSKMGKAQKNRLARSVYAFSNFKLKNDYECDDYYIEMIDY